MAKIPLTESNTKATPSKQNSTKSPKRSTSNKLQSTTPSSARKIAVRKNSSAIDRSNEVNIETKENTDLALEINITTGPNVQVNQSAKNIILFLISSCHQFKCHFNMIGSSASGRTRD